MIEVRTGSQQTHTFDAADAKWKIDEERQLHLFTATDGVNTSIASYSANQWESVRVTD